MLNDERCAGRETSKRWTVSQGQDQAVCDRDHTTLCLTAQEDRSSRIGQAALTERYSVGAHYREARRARSNAEFISKFEGGMQELEETLYWLELFEESGIVVGGQVSILQKEANELMAIMVVSVKTAKRIS